MSAGTTSVLVVTLGGSPDPIVTSISTLRPDRVVFLATAQSAPQIDEIIKKLPYQPQIERRDVEHPDDLDTLYQCCVTWLGELLEQPSTQAADPQSNGGSDLSVEELAQATSPPVDVKVDFTGGTKSMAAALSLAAFDLSIPVYLTTAPRTDAIKVSSGERTRPVHLDGMLQRRWLSNVVAPQLERFEFDAAAHELGRIVEAIGSRVAPWLEELTLVVEGLAAWDRFDLDTARERLKPYKSGTLSDAVAMLGRVTAERDWLEKPEEHRPPQPIGMMVGDLIRNAERRAALGRYDDAVARLYRALELAAQSRLLAQFGIRTAEFNPAALGDRRAAVPETLEGKSKLGLVDSWTLLAALDPSVANFYLPKEEELKKVLLTRNHSILAHGFTPVGQHDWADASELISTLLWELLATAGVGPERVLQLPNDFGRLVTAVGGPAQPAPRLRPRHTS